MPEDIGHFKVVIEGEVDKNLGKDLEDNIEKSGKRGAGKLEKQIRTILGSSSFTKFLDKTFDLSKKIAGKFEGGDGKTYAKAGAAYQSMTNPEHLQPLTKGAEASGGELGGLAGIVTKLGILVGAIMMVVGAVMMVVGVLQSLAPIQAILKMLTAVIQITLYPIAQVLLAILKPIFVLLLKYFILPFYQKVMPVIETLGKWLGDMLGLGAEALGAVAEKGGELAAAGFDALIMGWNNMVAIIEGVMTILTSIITMSWENFVIIITTVTSIIGTIFSGLWQTIKVIFDTAIQVIIALFTGKWSEIPGILSTGWEKIKEIFFTTIEIIKTKIFNGWEKIKTNISEHIEGIKKTISETWEKIKANTVEKFTDIIDHLKNIFGVDIMKEVVKIFDSIYNAIVSPLTRVFDWINNKISSFTSSSFGGGGSSGRNYPPTAEGGIVTGPQVRLVGERGPEAIIPLSKMGSMGNTIIINNTFNDTRISNDYDINDIVAKIERVFYTNSKRSGVR